MKFARLTLSHGFDHTHGTFAVDPLWPYDQDPDHPFIEGGVGILGHRRDIPWDRNGDGKPDPIVWASYEPPQPGIQLQFSWEGWADPNVDYRFEIIRVGPGDNFRMWINGLESNLTWYGDISHNPPLFGPGAKYVPGADRVTVYGEDNSANDTICDEFDIGFSGLVPPMTREPHAPDAPWTSCFDRIIPPWTSGEFWLASKSPSYSLCCPACYSPQGVERKPGGEPLFARAETVGPLRR